MSRYSVPRVPMRMPRRVPSIATPEALSVIAQLVAARHAARLSQAQVAEAMGWPPTAVCDLECGRRLNGPSATVLVRYAQAVGVTAIAIPASGEPPVPR